MLDVIEVKDKNIKEKEKNDQLREINKYNKEHKIPEIIFMHMEIKVNENPGIPYKPDSP